MAIEQQMLEAAFTECSNNFSALVRAVRHPEATAIGRWSIGDVAAHISHAFQMELGAARGEAPPTQGLDELPTLNDRMLEADAERNPVALADRLDTLSVEFCKVLSESSVDEIVNWHAGIKVPVSTLGAILISEMLIHGFDIARAEGKEWPIRPSYASLVFEGLAPLVPYYVDKEAATGFRGTYDLRLRGEVGRRFYFVFDDGELTIEEPSTRAVDCHISADPVALMLVSYGRIGQWGPILKGKMFAWGRKPWLATKMTSLLRSP